MLHIYSAMKDFAEIMKTAQDSYTITIKQIVRFQEGMHLEKFQVHKIQNGRPSAIIHLDRHLVNCARWLDHYYKTKCEISGENASGKFRLYQIKNGRLLTIIHFHMADIW